MKSTKKFAKKIKLINAKMQTIQWDGQVFEGKIIKQEYDFTNSDNGYPYVMVSGKGKMTYENGDVYEGDFKRNISHGFGKFVSKIGNYEYMGEWTDGYFNGKGTYINNDGVIFNGHWIRGELCNTGTITYVENGFNYVYKGGIKEYDFDKYGTIKKIINGRAQIIYKGEFEYGKYNGFGVSYSNNKPWYSGFWKNSCANGFGILFNFDGNIEQIGFYEKGKFKNKITNKVIINKIVKNIKKTTDIHYMKQLNGEINKQIVNNPLLKYKVNATTVNKKQQNKKQTIRKCGKNKRIIMTDNPIVYY